MLTQRIGKSANEFQTTEGVSPEAVFLLGKDLNSFRRSPRACSTAAPSCAWRQQGRQTREQLES
jgi:twitching motility protein PilJ